MVNRVDLSLCTKNSPQNNHGKAHLLSSLLNQCGVMPIQTRVKFQTVAMVYKDLKAFNPQYMFDMFKSLSEASSRLTISRQSNKLYVPRKNVSVSRRSLRYCGAMLYDTLNNTIQNSRSVASFKYKAVKHFM